MTAPLDPGPVDGPTPASTRAAGPVEPLDTPPTITPGLTVGPLDIAAARVLCEAAEPGPWTARGNCVFVNGEEVILGRRDDTSAAFIAAARTLLPQALDDLEAARASDAGHVGYENGLLSRIERLTDERDHYREERAAMLRELERLRHALPIEGDFVCPDSLALVDQRAEVERQRNEIAFVRADLVRVMQLSSTYADEADRLRTALIDALDEASHLHNEIYEDGAETPTLARLAELRKLASNGGDHG